MASASPATVGTTVRRQNRALITIVVVTLILLALLAIAIRGLLEQRLQGNEASAIDSVRTLNTALYQYRQRHADAYPKTTAELRDNVDPILACGQATCLKSGYAFAYQLMSATAMGPHYVIVARPNRFGNTGRRSFYSDESGVVRYTDENRAPTENDETTS